jgi:hypothetical protein
VVPYEENEDSQSYYSEHSDEEDMKAAYELQYIVLVFDWKHSVDKITIM